MVKLSKVFYVLLSITISACTTSGSAVKSETILESSQLEHDFLTATNRVRAKARKCGDKYFPAAPALRLNKSLNKAAYGHSLDMFENQFLEHTSSNGDTLVQRMIRVDYLWKAVGENIAHNQKTIMHVIEDWLSSPGHCSNIMSSAYTETGIAQVNRYWTQVYAAPK